jgi:hypothetical protein
VGKRDWNIGEATADPEIEMIQGAGAYADENFVGAGFGLGDIGVLQNFGSAMLAEKDGFHDASGLFLSWEFSECGVVCPREGLKHAIADSRSA